MSTGLGWLIPMVFQGVIFSGLGHHGLPLALLWRDLNCPHQDLGERESWGLVLPQQSTSPTQPA